MVYHEWWLNYVARARLSLLTLYEESFETFVDKNVLGMLDELYICFAKRTSFYT